MGIRQKLGYDKKVASTGSGKLLRSWFSRGKISGHDARTAAGTIIEDNGVQNPLTKKLAKAGKSGKLPGNISRDVVRTISGVAKKPQVYSTSFLIWDEKLDKQVETQIYLLLPYEKVDYEILTRKKLTGNRNPEIARWCHLSQDNPLYDVRKTWMDEMGLSGDDEASIAVCGLWGDGAVYHTRDSLHLLLFNVLSGVDQTRHWIGAYSKKQQCQCGCKGLCTIESIWRILVWVSLVWSTMEYPATRDDGVLFADSKKKGDRERAKRAGEKMLTRGAFLQKRADWCWLKQIILLMGWSGEGALKRCCYKCLANMSTIPFNDPTTNGLWRSNLLSHQIFLQLCFLQGSKVSGLFDILGLRMEHVSIDLMHVGDLGILLYLQGQILYELFIEMGGVFTRKGTTLSDFMDLIRTASPRVGQQRPPINTITIAMIRKEKKAPQLSAKGAESRHLLPVICYILRHYFPADTPEKLLRLQCVEKPNEMYQTMYVRGAAFDGEAAARKCREHLVLYSERSRLALETLQHQRTGWVAWRYYPKHHLFNHFELQVAKSGSPMNDWCYGDESSVGDAVKVAESAHALTLHRLVTEKNRLLD